jgi:hypothetical protein
VLESLARLPVGAEARPRCRRVRRLGRRVDDSAAMVRPTGRRVDDSADGSTTRPTGRVDDRPRGREGSMLQRVLAANNCEPKQGPREGSGPPDCIQGDDPLVEPWCRSMCGTDGVWPPTPARCRVRLVPSLDVPIGFAPNLPMTNVRPLGQHRGIRIADDASALRHSEQLHPDTLASTTASCTPTARWSRSCG